MATDLLLWVCVVGERTLPGQRTCQGEIGVGLAATGTPMIRNGRELRRWTAAGGAEVGWAQLLLDSGRMERRSTDPQRASTIVKRRSRH